MLCYNDHILNEEKKVNLLKKVFFNYFDKKSQRGHVEKIHVNAKELIFQLK